MGISKQEKGRESEEQSAAGQSQEKHNRRVNLQLVSIFPLTPLHFQQGFRTDSSPSAHPYENRAVPLFPGSLLGARVSICLCQKSRGEKKPIG